MLYYYINNTYNIALVFLLGIFPTIFGQRLDITHHSKYFKINFHSSWVYQNPTIERGWIPLDETVRSGFPAFYQIDYPGKLKRSDFLLKKYPDATFTPPAL